MFASDVPTYLIDLDHPEAIRWAEVISSETTVARDVYTEAGERFERVPELFRWVFARLYQWSRGRYQGEIAAWANALGVSLGTATILNCAYELSHLRLSMVFGCTAGVRWVEGLGMVHVRTLDWPLPTMAAATRLFRFRRGTREFVSIGVPGQVGVLSGMLPHAYSVTINWAPPTSFPRFDFGPMFLLRETLETCDSYDAAVDTLKRTPLATSVFYTVCGTERNQACVIERTRRDAHVREMLEMDEPVLVQTNHYDDEKKFSKHNAEIRAAEKDPKKSFLKSSSRERQAALKHALTSLCFPCSLDEAVTTLKGDMVSNQLTCQQMAFCPRSGDVKVRRRAEG